jgi:PAS domain-containing protein
MNTSESLDPKQIDALVAELRSGQLELEAMANALDQAHAELARARERLVGGSNPADAVREVLALVLPEMGRPALLVDTDLWVVAGNDAAATALGVDPSELTGSALARWPHAIERSRAVREALSSPAGPMATDQGDVVVSLGFDESVPSARRAVLVMLAS